MDSNCVNILNNLSYNYCKIDNKLRKINNRIKKLQKEIDIIDNLFLEQIAFIWATEDFSFERDKVKKTLGEDIFNTCAFEVDTYNDIKNKVQELIDQGRKYIITTNTSSVSSIIDLIYEYKDILFISINSTDTRYSNISNLKKMEPDNSFLAKTIVQAFSEDYNIFKTDFNKLNVVGLYDSNGLFSTDLFNLINIENSKLININIKWFDTYKYLSGNEQQKKEWLKEWTTYFNDLNYSFDFIYISTDNTFIDDKISIYPLSEYLYKCYFSDAVIGLTLDEYRVQPFGSLLSKSFFTFIKSEFINLYLLLVDAITSIRCKDFYQIENLYYTKLINFNQNLNNIDNFNLFPSKQLFSTYTTTNQDEQDYINLINFLTEVNYKRFIRSELELQLIIVVSVIKELNFYETLTTNEKGNYNIEFNIPYLNNIYRFFFYGANSSPNNTVFIQDISKENISNIRKSLDVNSDINIITSYNSYFQTNTSFISGVIQIDSNTYSLYQATMFNTAFTKSLFYINQQFNLQNASRNFINYIGTTNQESKTNLIYNNLNRCLQNILIFYKWSTVNNNNLFNIWTLMYLNQNFNGGSRRLPLINTTNFRILLKLNNGGNKLLIGFQNKLGGDTSQFNYVNPPGFDSVFFDLTKNTNFYNNNDQQNIQFNNINLSSDYFKFDSTTNKWIPNINNNNNQINMLLDLVKIYLVSFKLDNKNIIKNDCFLSAIMISFSQTYFVKDSYFANLPNIGSGFDLTNNPNWSQLSDTNVFENKGPNTPVYNFMMQFTNGFKLWNQNNTQDLSSLNIPKTKIVSGNISNNSLYCPQYTYQDTVDSNNNYYLGGSTNNLNSINVDIFRKINTSSSFNNCLFYFDEQIPPTNNPDKPWLDSRALFINGLNPQ
jgi:hypothetical protein